MKAIKNVEGQNKGNEVCNIVCTRENQIIKTSNFYTKNSCIGNDDDDDDEGEAIDMDAFVESGLLEDDSVISSIFFFSKCSTFLVMVLLLINYY